MEIRNSCTTCNHHISPNKKKHQGWAARHWDGIWDLSGDCTFPRLVFHLSRLPVNHLDHQINLAYSFHIINFHILSTLLEQSCVFGLDRDLLVVALTGVARTMWCFSFVWKDIVGNRHVALTDAASHCHLEIDKSCSVHKRQFNVS
jgi:hypothetical protein